MVAGWGHGRGRTSARRLRDPAGRGHLTTIGQHLSQLLWKKRLAQEALKWRGKHKGLDLDDIPLFNPLGQVFPDEAGQPMNPEFVSRLFKRDLDKAGLPEIRFHDLRHGHATMLIELGEDLKLISERLGHSTISMTADTYGHIREIKQREASIKLDKVLNLGN